MNMPKVTKILRNNWKRIIEGLKLVRLQYMSNSPRYKEEVKGGNGCKDTRIV